MITPLDSFTLKPASLLTGYEFCLPVGFGLCKLTEDLMTTGNMRNISVRNCTDVCCFYNPIKLQSEVQIGLAGYSLTSNHPRKYTFNLPYRAYPVLETFASPGKVKQMDLSAERDHQGNSPFDFLSRWVHHHGDGNRDVVVLNVLLLGGHQCGRSSVGNALLGGHEFQTGRSISGVTTECRLLWRTFPHFFRRQGAVTDLMLRIIDTPPGVSDPQSVHRLCPEGIHVLSIVVRADLPQEDVRLQQHAEKLLGPEWRQHAILILTHADHLREMGLQPSAYLAQSFTGWLRDLAGEIGGGIWFLDNTSDWPLVRGRPLRDQILCLSAKNHHRALTVRTETSI